MNKEVPLLERKPRRYTKVWNALKSLDRTFLLGVGTFVVLPQFIASSTFGRLLTVVLVACALLAIGIGITIYQRVPYRNESLSISLISPVSFSQESWLKKAA
jgi:hypothetical protein